MSENNLRILVSADLNQRSSISQINKTLREIQKSPQLKNLKIKVDIDTKGLKVLQDFNKVMQSMQKQQFNNIANTTQQINNQTQALLQATKAQKQLNVEQTRTVLDRSTKEAKQTTTTYGSNSNNNKQIVVTDPSGAILKDPIETTNPKKDLLEAQKLANQMADGRIREHEKFQRLEEAAQKKRIDAAYRLAEAENKRFDARKKQESDYDSFWQKALHNREQQEIQAQQKIANDRLKLEQDTEQRWLKNLHDKEQKQKQVEEGRIKNENLAWFEAHREKEKREEYLHGKRVQDTYRAYGLAQEEDRKFNEARLKRETDFRQSVERQRAKLMDIERRFEGDTRVAEGAKELRSKLDGVSITNNDTAEFREFQKNVGNAKPLVNYKEALRDVDIEMQKLVSTAKTTGSHVDGLAKQFGIAISRTITWSITMGTLYGTLHKLQQAIDVIIQVDTQMTTLKRVMDEDTNFDRMLEGSIKIAKELGRTITEVNEAMTGFARQGYSEDQVLALSRTATLMGNISELTGEESMSSLTAAMTIFNIEASESMRIVDALNEVKIVCLLHMGTYDVKPFLIDLEVLAA